MFHTVVSLYWQYVNPTTTFYYRFESRVYMDIFATGKLSDRSTVFQDVVYPTDQFIRAKRCNQKIDGIVF